MFMCALLYCVSAGTFPWKVHRYRLLPALLQAHAQQEAPPERPGVHRSRVLQLSDLDPVCSVTEALRVSPKAAQQKDHKLIYKVVNIQYWSTPGLIFVLVMSLRIQEFYNGVLSYLFSPLTRPLVPLVFYCV